MKNYIRIVRNNLEIIIPCKNILYLQEYTAPHQPGQVHLSENTFFGIPKDEFKEIKKQYLEWLEARTIQKHPTITEEIIWKNPAGSEE